MHAVKLTKIGNSVGVILPKEVLEKLHVGRGDVIYITEGKDGFRVTAYDEKFAEQMREAEEIMRSDKDVLRTLAK